MTTLHTVNKFSMNADALSSCLRVANRGDCVLLLEDGAYNVRSLQNIAAALNVDLSVLDCRVMKDDLLARGLAEADLPRSIGTVNYAEFVSLACTHQQSVHWF